MNLTKHLVCTIQTQCHLYLLTSIAHPRDTGICGTASGSVRLLDADDFANKYHTVAHDPHSPISTDEILIQDFLVILKCMLQNY